MLDALLGWEPGPLWALIAGVATAIGAVALAVVRVMAATSHVRKAQRRRAELDRFKQRADRMLRHEKTARRTFRKLTQPFPHLDPDDLRFALRDLGAVAGRAPLTGEEVWGYPDRSKTLSAA